MNCSIRTSEFFPWPLPYKRTCLALAGLLCLLAGAAPAKTLPGHWRRAFASAPLAGAPAPDQSLILNLGLDFSDQAGLADFVQRVYDPRDPLFRRFLSPGQFIQRFSPGPADYQAVLDFAKASGFEVAQTWPNRLMVTVSAPVSLVEQAFHLRLRNHKRADMSLFYAPDQDPSIDDSLPLKTVTGLDNWHRLRPHARPRPIPGKGGAARRKYQDGSAGNSSWGYGYYQGWDFRQAYVPDATAGLQGSGQRIGLVEFQGYYLADIAAYCAGLTPPMTVPAITVRAVDNFKVTPVTTPTSSEPDPLGDNGEVSLDMETALSMAPQAALTVYEAPYVASINDVLAAVVQPPLCAQVSCSWSTDGDNTTRNLFAQMAAQGQAFLNASGDYGAYSASNPIAGPVSFPDSLSPYITEVGGTNLGTQGVAGSPGWRTYTAETVWNDYYGSCSPTDPNAYGGASGGGICDTNDPAWPAAQLALPAWQAGLATAANGGSGVWRDIPDVSISGENFWVRDNNGKAEVFDGTSGSAPLWAGFMALVNQQAAASGRGLVGCPNPLLYQLAQTPATYAQDFHDIADASNNCLTDTSGTSCDTVSYKAVAGYDLTTGLGSPKGMSLINDLVGIIPTPTASPTATPTRTASPTSTPTPTISPTYSVSPTFTISPTPTMTPFFQASGLGRTLLAPVPVRQGQPLCLYFEKRQLSSKWSIFNTAGDAVADLAFNTEFRQCWDTSRAAPGVYLVRLDIIYMDQSENVSWQKVAVTP